MKHRLASAYNPQSNGRAEVAVKVMKRILMENVSGSGSLDTDRVLKAILCYKNTPDESGLSPAMILMGRQLRDSLPAIPRGGSMFQNENVAKPWRDMWATKEIALADRLGKGLESLNEKVRSLPQLEVGQKVRVQDLTKAKKKWLKSGTIVQVGDHHQYLVRMDGSRRVVLRNRKFLRAYQRLRDDKKPRDDEKTVREKIEPQKKPTPPLKPILKEKGREEPGHQNSSRKRVKLHIPEVPPREEKKGGTYRLRGVVNAVPQIPQNPQVEATPHRQGGRQGEAVAPAIMRREVVDLLDVTDEDGSVDGQEGVARGLFQDEVQFEPQVEDQEDDRHQLDVPDEEVGDDWDEGDEDQFQEGNFVQPPAAMKTPGPLRAIRNFCTPGGKDIVATEDRARLRSKEKERRQEEDDN